MIVLQDDHDHSVDMRWTLIFKKVIVDMPNEVMARTSLVNNPYSQSILDTETFFSSFFAWFESILIVQVDLFFQCLVQFGGSDSFFGVALPATLKDILYGWFPFLFQRRTVILLNDILPMFFLAELSKSFL
jgi:hypothetical protein